ncbi:hypothetical protein A6U86_05645 [Rhizobium sp. AC27/96]|nr:hypothetical protein A6U86_05645 [Rhizobium sp. AC27/96]
MGYPVAECRITPCASWAKGPRKYEEAEANAYLVAAAPALLECLKDARSQLSDQEKIDLVYIDEVIAKAEGRS